MPELQRTKYKFFNEANVRLKMRKRVEIKYLRAKDPRLLEGKFVACGIVVREQCHRMGEFRTAAH